jgi:hypothetical protein
MEFRRKEITCLIEETPCPQRRFHASLRIPNNSCFHPTYNKFSLHLQLLAFWLDIQFTVSHLLMTTRSLLMLGFIMAHTTTFVSIKPMCTWASVSGCWCCGTSITYVVRIEVDLVKTIVNIMEQETIIHALMLEQENTNEVVNIDRSDILNFTYYN